jgi:hypothetical protein
MNPLDRIRQTSDARKNRREARARRREVRGILNARQLAWFESTVADIWGETGDIGEAERLTKTTINARAGELGFDPSTILLLVQLAILIYKALKHLNVLNPTPEVVLAIFEGDGDE